MAQETKKFTWADLKDFCDKLDPKYIDAAVRCWGIDRGGIVHSMFTLEEDHFLSNDGFVAESDTKDCEDGYIDFGIKLDKETPIIWLD